MSDHTAADMSPTEQMPAAAPPQPAPPVLSVSELSVSYGGVRAVQKVSLDVHAGEAVAILGANGAGKTSLLRAISGLVTFTGTVTVQGTRTTGRKPEDIARLGLAHVPDNRGIFDDLSVRENLVTALYGSGRHQDPDGLAAVEEVFDLFPILGERQAQPAGTMSGGQQQMLTIARALVQRPSLIMIDEMSMGLAPSIVSELFETVGRLTDQGLAVVLVEQFVDQALAVVDRALVLSGGHVVAAGTAQEMAESDVAAHYLGGGNEDATGDEAGTEHPLVELPDSETVSASLNARELRALEALAVARGTTPEQIVSAAVRDNLDGQLTWPGSDDAAAAGEEDGS